MTEFQLDHSKLGLSTEEKIRISIIYSALGIATLAGLAASIIIGQLSTLLAGLGVLAFTFGLRHGVDADHIVAIDNTTRKLLQEGKRPLTVGMWFSLGHSTVVVGLIVSLILATNAVKDQIPALRSSGAIIGTTVSGIFLFLIGLINVIIVLGIYRVFTTLKQGKMKESELDSLLENRGFLNRYFKGLFKIVREPWQIYPIGVLFGLGFDTASEIALIAITVGVGVSSAVPLWMILVLPFMFTCGMVLVDMTDGITMLTAYGWAFLRPIRKIYYNLTVTIISVAVAFAIGGIELLQVLSNELKLTGPFWKSLATLDFETMGYGIIGIFVVSWLASMAYWKYKRYDELYNRTNSTVLISERGSSEDQNGPMPSQKKPISKPTKRIRILVAKPGLDGHDRGALILTRAFRDAGMEVIYTGFLATPEQVAQMAIDEDVDVVAMSLLNGAHMTAFPKVAKLIREKGGDDILLVGGGIIPDEDKPLLEKQGITGNFGPGTPLKTIIEHVEMVVSERDSKKKR